MESVKEEVAKLLEVMQKELLEKAAIHRDEHTTSATTMEDIAKTIKETPGFVKAMWCGDVSCEEKIKEETGADIRVIPFGSENNEKKCMFCQEQSVSIQFLQEAIRKAPTNIIIQKYLLTQKKKILQFLKTAQSN